MNALEQAKEALTKARFMVAYSASGYTHSGEMTAVARRTLKEVESALAALQSQVSEQPVSFEIEAALGINSQFNACMYRQQCRAMLAGLSDASPVPASGAAVTVTDEDIAKMLVAVANDPAIPKLDDDGIREMCEDRGWTTDDTPSLRELAHVFFAEGAHAQRRALLSLAAAPTDRPAACGGRDYCSRHPFCGCGAVPLFPERDPSKPAEQQGLFRKFDVRRTDGSDAPDGKHYGCRYYVLDLNHDQHAPAAMRAYAAACKATHPQLAADIEAEFAAAPQQEPEVPFANDPFVCESCNKLRHADAMSTQNDGNKLVCVNCAASHPQAAPQTDDDLAQVLEERDRYHDMADELAEAIAQRFGIEIGEHSNQNCPWTNALEWIAAAPQQEPVVADLIRDLLTDFKNEFPEATRYDSWKAGERYLAAVPSAPADQEKNNG